MGRGRRWRKDVSDGGFERGKRMTGLPGVALGVYGGKGDAAVHDAQVGLVFQVESAEGSAGYGLSEADDGIGVDDGAAGEVGRCRGGEGR